MDSSAVYVIRVAGVVDERWSSYMGGLSITVTQPGEGDALLVTTLEGQLIDQAALMGVLNTLYNYQYALLSVECQGDGRSEHAPEQN